MKSTIAVALLVLYFVAILVIAPNILSKVAKAADKPLDSAPSFSVLADRLIKEGYSHTTVNKHDLEFILQVAWEVQKEYPDIPYDIILGLISIESGFRSDLVSSAGACGLTQVIPEWHQDRMEKIGTSQLFGPYSSIAVGIDYLNELRTGVAKGDIFNALRCYNAGPGAIHSQISGEYASSVLIRSAAISMLVGDSVG